MKATMIYRRRRSLTSSPSGFYRFENVRNRSGMFGFAEGDFIRLRDEYGAVWNGVAEHQGDNVFRYRFRNEAGRWITGVSDSFGIVLRDEKGNTWRGYME